MKLVSLQIGHASVALFMLFENVTRGVARVGGGGIPGMPVTPLSQVR